METRYELTLPERIIAVQKQLKIAIQNYQLMLQRKQLLQNRDEKIKPHLEIVKFMMINSGKTQTSLLNQYRHELATKYNLKPNDSVVTNIMKSNLKFYDTPKNIPRNKPSLYGDNENKKALIKPKMKSILKVSNKEYNENVKNKIGICKLNEVIDMKAKAIYNKRKVPSSVLVQQNKKFQSVLKTKSTHKSEPNKSERCDKLFEDDDSPVSISSSSSSEETPPHAGSPIEEIDLTISPTPPSRMDTRYGKKYEAKLLGSSKGKVSSDQHSLNKIVARGVHNGQKSQKFSSELHLSKETASELDLKDQDEWVPFPTVTLPSRQAKMNQLDQDTASISDLNKETFLGLFRLVSIEKCEMLKRKRCERKRRSVAGQNSLYSDYLQPQPKRSYAPRKSTAPVVQANNNAVIVESSAADDDDEDKEKPACIICHEGDGILESCYGCNENFHFNCLPSNQKEICPSPNCMAQRTISNIVGANISSGNASDLELVKRYSSDDLGAENRSGDVKQPVAAVIAAK